MEFDQQLIAIRHYVHNLFHEDATGHDYFHMIRVAHLARQIAKDEKADPFICEAAGLLHDIGDRKLFDNPVQVLYEMDAFLASINMTAEQISQIKMAIKDVSFSKGVIPKSLEGKIVQDSDRLDAIGAIGIARTFAYGGANGQLIYHDSAKENTSIQHFYDKLLTLKYTMNTKAARDIADIRHTFIKTYLEQFHIEWGTQ